MVGLHSTVRYLAAFSETMAQNSFLLPSWFWLTVCGMYAAYFQKSIIHRWPIASVMCNPEENAAKSCPTVRFLDRKFEATKDHHFQITFIAAALIWACC